MGDGFNIIEVSGIELFRRNRGNLWERMRDYINRCGIGYILTRPELMHELKRTESESTIDTYRNYLTQAGYLRKYGFGLYKIAKEIPMMSLTNLKAEAYEPKAKHEPYLTWGSSTDNGEYFHVGSSSDSTPKKKKGFLSEKDFEL